MNLKAEFLQWPRERFRAACCADYWRLPGKCLDGSGGEDGASMLWALYGWRWDLGDELRRLGQSATMIDIYSQLPGVCGPHVVATLDAVPV
jgi:hypothetical protein